MGLPGREDSLTIGWAVSTQYQRVTDGQTDGQTDSYKTYFSKADACKKKTSDVVWQRRRVQYKPNQKKNTSHVESWNLVYIFAHDKGKFVISGYFKLKGQRSKSPGLINLGLNMCHYWSGAYPEIWIMGVKGWGLVPSPPLPPLPPLRSRPLNPITGAVRFCPVMMRSERFWAVSKSFILDLDSRDCHQAAV